MCIAGDHWDDELALKCDDELALKSEESSRLKSQSRQKGSPRPRPSMLDRGLFFAEPRKVNLAYDRLPPPSPPLFGRQCFGVVAVAGWRQRALERVGRLRCDALLQFDPP